MNIYMRFREFRKTKRVHKLPLYITKEQIIETVGWTKDYTGMLEGPRNVVSLRPTRIARKIFIIETILKHHGCMDRIVKTCRKYVLLKDGQTLPEECVEDLLNVGTLVATSDEVK